MHGLRHAVLAADSEVPQARPTRSHAGPGPAAGPLQRSIRVRVTRLRNSPAPPAGPEAAAAVRPSPARDREHSPAEWPGRARQAWVLGRARSGPGRAASSSPFSASPLSPLPPLSPAYPHKPGRRGGRTPGAGAAAAAVGAFGAGSSGGISVGTQSTARSRASPPQRLPRRQTLPTDIPTHAQPTRLSPAQPVTTTVFGDTESGICIRCIHCSMGWEPHH